MPNDSRRKLATRFIPTRGVQAYRSTIPFLVGPSDTVLELGYEWGATTQVLAGTCKEVIGTDVSQEVIKRARRLHPDIRFEVLDAFDVRAALDLGKVFTKLDVDLSGFSGYRSLLDIIALLTMYSTALRPDTIVVKSAALKQFPVHCVAWRRSALKPELAPLRGERGG